jgi:hypothetical protein
MHLLNPVWAQLKRHNIISTNFYSILDIEKELDPILEDLNRSVEAEEAKQLRETFIARHERFKTLVSDVINPTMSEYARYLNERGQTAQINIHWRFFDITFEIHGNDSRTHGYIGILEFSQVSDRIKVVEQIRGDSIDKIYNEDQITTELVKNRVVNFIKDFYKIYV